jgi:polar amino acid transport system permease protein
MTLRLRSGLNLLIYCFFIAIRLGVRGTLLAMLIGITMGLCRVSTGLFRRIDSGMYIEITRNISLPAIIFIFYFFVSDQIPQIFGTEESVRALSLTIHEFFSFFFAPPILFPAFLFAVITLALLNVSQSFEIRIAQNGLQSRFTVKRFCKSFQRHRPHRRTIMIFCPAVCINPYLFPVSGTY